MQVSIEYIRQELAANNGSVSYEDLHENASFEQRQFLRQAQQRLKAANEIWIYIGRNEQGVLVHEIRAGARPSDVRAPEVQ